MELHFLGTGSAFPSPKRCSSCIALRLDNGDVWIFDCGEGAQIQIQKSKIRPAKIRKIFISHLHGDHLFGLPGMMCTISQAIENEHVDIYGPIGIKNFLRVSLMSTFSNLSYTFTVHEILVDSIEEFKEKETITLDIEYWSKLSDISKISLPAHPNEIDKGKQIIRTHNSYFEILSSDQVYVMATEIRHSVPCLGYIIKERNIPGKLDVSILKAIGVPSGPLYGKLKNGESIILENGTIVEPKECIGPERPGRKVVILGDTHDPSLITELAEGATVLVHESTNENSDEEKAISHGHSTAGMAGVFALSIQAKLLVLTHFSQRYSDEDTTTILVEEAKETFQSDNVIAASDLSVIAIPQPK